MHNIQKMKIVPNLYYFQYILRKENKAESPKNANRMSEYKVHY